MAVGAVSILGNYQENYYAHSHAGFGVDVCLRFSGVDSWGWDCCVVRLSVCLTWWETAKPFSCPVPSAAHGASGHSASSSALGLSILCLSILVGVSGDLTVILTYVSLATDDGTYLFMCLFSIQISWVQCLLNSSAILKIRWLVFLFLSCETSFYILDRRDVLCTNLLPACGLSFHFPNGVFQRAEVLNFDKVQFILSSFYGLYFSCPMYPSYFWVS